MFSPTFMVCWDLSPNIVINKSFKAESDILEMVYLGSGDFLEKFWKFFLAFEDVIPQVWHFLCLWETRSGKYWKTKYFVQLGMTQEDVGCECWILSKDFQLRFWRWIYTSWKGILRAVFCSWHHYTAGHGWSAGYLYCWAWEKCWLSHYVVHITLLSLKKGVVQICEVWERAMADLEWSCRCLQLLRLPMGAIQSEIAVREQHIPSGRSIFCNAEVAGCWS